MEEGQGRTSDFAGRGGGAQRERSLPSEGLTLRATQHTGRAEGRSGTEGTCPADRQGGCGRLWVLRLGPTLPCSSRARPHWASCPTHAPPTTTSKASGSPRTGPGPGVPVGVQQESGQLPLWPPPRFLQ